MQVHYAAAADIKANNLLENAALEGILNNCAGTKTRPQEEYNILVSTTGTNSSYAGNSTMPRAWYHADFSAIRYSANLISSEGVLDFFFWKNSELHILAMKGVTIIVYNTPKTR